MTKPPTSRKKLTRRNFISLGGGMAALAGVNLLPAMAKVLANPAPVQAAIVAAPPMATSTNIHLVGTDGWIYLPGPSSIVGDTPPRTVYPDPLAPGGRTTYIFGFRNVTGLSSAAVNDQKGKAQAPAPLLYVDQEADVRITLTNLGLQVRPDLVDSHTIHWHGFRNAIPLFDGVPEMSIAVPIGRDFTYYYKPHDPGTYMYHCHFEDVEHVQMGMTGVVFVRPAMNTPTQKYVYNDASTAYDREFVIFLTELWASAHYDDAHIQVSDWSEYSPDFWLMNGRCFPDTLQPAGDPLTIPGQPVLQYQPISSLVKANAGERVLLRFVNLGYQQHAMTLDGLSMRIVGKDATLLKGLGTTNPQIRNGADVSYETNTVYIGPGESYDAIFTAPNVTTDTTYLLYNRKFMYLNNGGTGTGGQMTEVRISPAGTLSPQAAPNT